MRIGKNLSGIDVKYDYSSLVTKLYPRGSGSAPSELTFDNPGWWPSGDLCQLVYDHSDGEYANFRLAGDYSAYVGDPDYGDGWPINSNFYIGRGLNTMYNSLWDGQSLSSVKGNYIAAPSDAQAMIFYNAVGGLPWVPARIYDVSFVLQRIISDTPTQWTTQPRFIVGLYTAQIAVNPVSTNTAGAQAPYQGPLCWCYGNLLSIDSTTPQWYHFPLQTNAYPVGFYAIVIMPYPTSNKQWSFNDYLSVGLAAPTSTSANHWAAVCHTGVTPKNWVSPAQFTGTTSSQASQFAFQLRTVATDVSSQFTMSGKDPGRMVKTPLANYVAGAQYYFHYLHTPYIINWDAYDQFGKIEGTYKDDSCTTQNALYLGAQQFLASASQPVMTISLSAADLYDLDPDKNWAEELYVGGLVKVVDDVLGLDAECVITKIEKQDMTQPHVIDTLTLNNVHVSAQKFLAQLSRSNLRSAKYQQGQTVEAPYTTAGSATSGSPAEMTFSIRDGTTLTHSVRLTVDAPSTFTMAVDGNAVGGAFSGANEIDVVDYLTKAHNGQPTSGIHTVTISTT